jgi:hypothetical protein
MVFSAPDQDNNGQMSQASTGFVRDYFPQGKNPGKMAATSSSQYNFNAYARLINGPAKNRVNIGITCDGYAVGDTVNFPAQAQNNINYRRGLSTIAGNARAMRPYLRYDKFMNWYLINLVSPQSGVSTQGGTTINNALGAMHDNDRLGWVDDSKAGALFSQAQQRLGVTIHWHEVIININGYYNSGGPYVVFAYVNWGDIACHEAGHGFHNFDDEYFVCDGSTDNTDHGEMNSTSIVGSSKWSVWVGYKDIAPEVAANPPWGCDNGGDTIGYFQGSDYVQYGQYRPSNNSKMNSTSQGSPTSFSAPCREKIIHDIYSIVKPIDTLLLDTGTTKQVTDPDSVWVKVIDPNVLHVDWYVNGTLKKANGGTSLLKSDIAAATGTYTVKAHVYDECIRHAYSPNKTPDSLDLVRKDTSKMFQDVQWRVQLTSVLAAGFSPRQTQPFAIEIDNEDVVYTLQHPASVSVSLYTTGGALVRTVRAVGTAGRNVFRLAAGNNGGVRLAQGLYFVKLSVGPEYRITAMIVH